MGCQLFSFLLSQSSSDVFSSNNDDDQWLSSIDIAALDNGDYLPAVQKIESHKISTKVQEWLELNAHLHTPLLFELAIAETVSILSNEKNREDLKELRHKISVVVLPILDLAVIRLQEDALSLPDPKNIDMVLSKEIQEKSNVHSVNDLVKKIREIFEKKLTDLLFNKTGHNLDELKEISEEESILKLLLCRAKDEPRPKLEWMISKRISAFSTNRIPFGGGNSRSMDEIRKEQRSFIEREIQKLEEHQKTLSRRNRVENVTSE